MKAKTLIMATLVVLVFTGAVYLLATESSEKSESSKGSDTTTTKQDSTNIVSDSTKPKDSTEVTDKVIAYYFHGNRRCGSCRKIEAYSREAIDSGFAEELKAGKLEWLVINIDKPENKHFVKDYQLYTRSLVISYTENGKQTRWKNLEKVWQLLRNKAAFMKYVQEEVHAYLEES